ncbi:ABC transporter permease [Candidatus Bathyarchaeota archaeon]|nr:MAG: ABC transporter permease [Candidatus Bathyarchaeota archaeon]
MTLVSPTLRDEITANMRAAKARMWVRIKGGNRELTHYIAEVVLPVLTIGAYVILYKTLGLPPSLGAAVIIGGAMIAFWTNILWNMSAQWFWEKEMGNLEMYMVAPVSRMSVLLGMAMGGAINTSLRATGIILLGVFVFQVPFQVHDLLVAGLVFLLTVISLYGLGMVFASLYMLYGREAWHTNMLLQEPVFFLSGTYFPTIYVSVIPVWLQVTATLIPMTVGLDAIRRVTIQGQGLMAVWPHILALIAFIAILIPVARMALNYMENLGKREGRLTLRWQ